MKIYVITNKLNGKQYVGCTIRTLKERLYAHEYNSKATSIGRAIKIDGVANFIIELLEEFNGDIDNDRESFWISQLNTLTPNGYNIAKVYNRGGVSERKGRPKLPVGFDRKKNRAFSFTDDEYKKLNLLAKEAGLGVSAYVIRKLKLDVKK